MATFYTGVDQQRYDAGEKFLPMNKFLASYTAPKTNLEESQVTNGAKFMEDLGADSLDIVELVMAIEAAFDLDIPDEEAENIRTVGDAIDFVKKMEKV